VAVVVEPISELPEQCLGAWHSSGITRHDYDPRCESCLNKHGPPVNLCNPEEVERWLST